jgi:hypothetical protein
MTPYGLCARVDVDPSASLRAVGVRLPALLVEAPGIATRGQPVRLVSAREGGPTDPDARRMRVIPSTLWVNANQLQ